MNDTPCVTVPVEPTEAMMKAADAVDWTNEDERASVINMWQAMLSAAPAPEGGADAWRIRTKENLHGDGAPPGRWIVSNILSLSSDTAHWYEIQPLRVSEPSQVDLDAMEAYGVKVAALATREEAPAEAGEVDEDWIRGLIGEAVCMAEDQEREDDGDKEICRIAESVLNAVRPYLRAQPTARSGEGQ